MSQDHNVSHGRGGQGNIGPDSTEYTDGSIHREADPAASGAAYSSGRGGAGNIGSPQQKPEDTGNNDDVVPEADIVPEVAKVEPHQDEAYHSGRGGEGNAVPAAVPKSKIHQGLAEKLKEKLFGLSKKKGDKKSKKEKAHKADKAEAPKDSAE
ncbi:hypothetical protein RUND412_010403 [Rhizina undulata]